MEDRIIQELNAVLGTNVDNISKSHELVDRYVNDLNEIESKVKRNCEISMPCLHFAI